MKKTLFFLLFLALLTPFAASAKAIGPSVSKYRGSELKWEDGAYGYHVMFKTLLENKSPDKNANNPQADSCMTGGSSYQLEVSHIPADAIIEDAYLVWAGAVAPSKKEDVTDSEVTFSFLSEDGKINETQTIKGKKSYKINEGEAGKVDFEFDAFRNQDNTDQRWFTYRVKILDFFKSIQEKGRESAVEGATFYDGYSLLGSYTLSDLDCTEDDIYKISTEMVSGWAVILIYSSSEISPKKIYLYDGFKPYFHELSEINVTGFEFPIDPEIRITLATHEGDPENCELHPDGALIAEGIKVQGAADDWLLLSNECNPPATKSDNLVTLNYTEIFNSISSQYGYADSVPTCIGGKPGALNNAEIEYAMDVDTFVMDSSTEGSYAAHFNKGGQQIKLRIGANQDQVITNFMIVSVDTKAPQFDIPGQPEKVACTPANIPVDSSLEGKWCSGNIEHTFALRIQNWGSDYTKAVIVSDSIPIGMEYVAGSTEYATDFVVQDGKKIAKKWIPIPDSGGFPLENGFKITDSLNFCKDGDDYLSCKDLIIVRFRAKVKSDTQKHQVLENTAVYKTTGLVDYKTNLGIPVKLRMISTGCVTSQDAVDLSDCGGKGAQGCETDEDCPDGYVCDSETATCGEDPSIVRCSNTPVTATIGKNSFDDETIFISAPQENLVIGQLELTGSGEKCYFNLDQVKLKIESKDDKVLLDSFKMYNDTNGNGLLDDADVLLGSADALESKYAVLNSSNPTNRLWGNKRNNILFVLNAAYAPDSEISKSASFSAEIEEDGGLLLSDGGAVTISGLPIEFSAFQFEPQKSFIITKGFKDPEVPKNKSDMNEYRDVLQLRLLAKGSDDVLNKIKIKIPNSKFVSFGSGIDKLAIFEDSDGDGVGDVEIGSATSFNSNQAHQFTNLNVALTKDVDKYLTVKAKLSLSDGKSFRIQVSSVDINNPDDKAILGLPVNSKTYEYSSDSRFDDVDVDEGGCSAISVEESGNGNLVLLIVSIAVLAFLGLFFRKFSSK